jgi:hypothetical protein
MSSMSSKQTQTAVTSWGLCVAISLRAFELMHRTDTRYGLATTQSHFAEVSDMLELMVATEKQDAVI